MLKCRRAAIINFNGECSRRLDAVSRGLLVFKVRIGRSLGDLEWIDKEVTHFEGWIAGLWFLYFQ
jgi:hypothetical protein